MLYLRNCRSWLWRTIGIAAPSCLFVSEEVPGKPRAATKEIPDNKTLTLLQLLYLDFSATLYRNQPTRCWVLMKLKPKRQIETICLGTVLRNIFSQTLNPGVSRKGKVSRVETNTLRDWDVTLWLFLHLHYITIFLSQGLACNSTHTTPIPQSKTGWN